MELVDHTSQSTLNFLHNFIPNTPTVTHIDLLPSLTDATEPMQQRRTLTLLQKTLKVLGDLIELKYRT